MMCLNNLMIISYENQPTVNLNNCNGFTYKENNNFEIIFSCIGKDIIWIFTDFNEGKKLYNYLLSNYTESLSFLKKCE